MAFISFFSKKTAKVQNTKTFLLVFLFVAGLFLTPSVLKAQSTVQFLGAAPGGGPSGNGPTTSAQTYTFYKTAATAYSPALTATFSLSNQQFSSIEGNASTPGSVLGGAATISSNGATTNNLASTGAFSLYPLMNVGTSSNAFYTACNTCTPGTGVTTANTYGTVIMNSGDALINSSGVSAYGLSDRVQFADLTITFNRPVTNPVLHLENLGGFFSYFTDIGVTRTNYTQGLTTDLDLITSGLTLTKLSGNSVLNVTSTQISNSAARFSTSDAGNTVVGGPTRYAAAGSVVVNGTNITSFTLRMYLRGDGGLIQNSAGTTVAANNGNFVQWSSQLNFVPRGQSAQTINAYTGDTFLMGLSFEEPAACTNPTITTQPTATTACTGNTMTVAATGTGLTYQWESSSDGVTSGGNAGEPGNTTNTLDVSSGAAGYYFRVKVSEGSCFTYSNWALLSACPPTCTAPSAITLTQTAPTCAGATANNDGKITISASTNGTHYGVSTLGAASYDGAAFASATAISGTPDVKTGISNTGGSYIIRIFNGSNTCYTDQTVTVAAVTCSCPATNYTLCAGESYTLTTQSGLTGIQWQVNTGAGYTNIPSATNSTYIATTVGVYKYTALDGAGCAITLCCPFTITSTPSPSAITLTQTAPTCTGATANNDGKITLTASTNGTHYGVSTVGAASYDGTAFASATAISGTPDVKTGILNTGGTYIIRIFNGSNTCYTDQTVTVAAVTCVVGCTQPSAITLTQTAPTCTGATANNDGKITLSASTNGTHYGVSTVGAASYDGAAFASATAISGTPDVKTGILNTGGTYIIRVFNGSNTCFTDQTVTVAAVSCSIPCPSPNCFTATVVRN